MERTARISTAFGDSWVWSFSNLEDAYKATPSRVSQLLGFCTNYEDVVLAEMGADAAKFQDRARFAVQAVMRGVCGAAASEAFYGKRTRCVYYTAPKFYVTQPYVKATGDSNPISHRYLIAVIDALARMGWIYGLGADQDSSFFFVDAEKLPKDLAGYHVSLPSTYLLYFRTDSKVNGPDLSCIQKAINRYRDLTYINGELVKNTYHVIADGTKFELSPTTAQYHAVYNSTDMTKGGRIYCGLQNLPSRTKKIRDTLLINGEETTEVDFSNLHIRMLYAKKGIEFDGDCYDIDIPGWDAPKKVQRRLLKVLLLALPNCGSPDKDARSNRLSAIATCRDQYALWLENNRDHGLPQGMTITTVLDHILAAHAPIADCFHTGQGILLQAEDGEMAVRIIKAMLTEGIPCIGVHDSFIVPSAHAERLMIVMTNVYRDMVGTTPVLDVKEHVHAQADVEVVGATPVHMLQNLNNMAVDTAGEKTDEQKDDGGERVTSTPAGNSRCVSGAGHKANYVPDDLGSPSDSRSCLHNLVQRPQAAREQRRNV